jgi:hypothetical protein
VAKFEGLEARKHDGTPQNKTANLGRRQKVPGVVVRRASLPSRRSGAAYLKHAVWVLLFQLRCDNALPNRFALPRIQGVNP